MVAGYEITLTQGKQLRATPVEGFLYGLLFAVFLAFLGVGGAFIFLPCALFVIAAPLCPLVGLAMKQGECPHCGKPDVTVNEWESKVKCEDCKRHLVVREGMLHGWECPHCGNPVIRAFSASASKVKCGDCNRHFVVRKGMLHGVD